MKEFITHAIASAPGKTAFFYKNLVTGEEFSVNPDMPFIAASVIKVPIMVEAFRQIECGLASETEEFIIDPKDKVPGCGVLTHMHERVSVQLIDLITLMIIVSDNTATNILMDRLGVENVDHTLESLGITNSVLRRKMYDLEKSRMGIQNHITAGDMGKLLEMLYRKEVVSENASARMLQILCDQKLNGKMPFYLDHIKIAHKTGEDDGTTHDVGVVYAEEPFVVCFLSNKTDVPMFEQTIQRVTQLLATGGNPDA